MPMMQYASKYPNHVHQLVVSVSRHAYAGADGRLKYQRKPLEMTLAKLPSATRRHAVIYSLRDHTSGIFYAEVTFAPGIMPLKTFLARAWGAKPDYPFHGLPELLTIPASVRNAFPGVAGAVERLGIQLVDVTSGFQGGIRDLRVVDEVMRVTSGRPVAELAAEIAWEYKRMAREVSRRGNESKLEMWQRHVGAVRALPDIW